MRYLIIVMMLSLMSCKKEVEVPLFAESAVVGYKDLKDLLTQTGEVEPLLQIKIQSEASGKIEKVHIRQGEKVSKGQPILEIDPSRLNFDRQRREIAVRRSKIEMDRSKRNLARAKKLHKSGNLSEREFLDKEDASKIAVLSYKQARLELSDITDQQKKTTLLAPMDGVITELNVAQGEIAVSATSGLQNGTDIANIANIDSLEVISRIGEADYIRLKKGQKVVIRPEAVENSQTTGTIDFVALSANKKGGEELSSFEVRIKVDSIIAGIAPGITVNVDFILMEKDSVLAIPYYYVKKEGKERFVYVNRGTEELPTIEKQVVTVGETDYQQYEVLSGLTKGEVVVLKSEEPRKRRRKK